MKITIKRAQNQTCLILPNGSNLEDAEQPQHPGQRMKAFRKGHFAVMSFFAVIFLAGCDVDDPIYNTSHPDQGKITLTTDWTARTAGIDIPVQYTVKSGEYAATVSGITNTLDNLFAPGTYPVLIYNAAEHITVGGTVATVAGASGSAGGAGKFVQEMPGWLFSCSMKATIEKDTDHEFTAAMQQQVRQLTLFVEPTGHITDKIERIEGYLSGVAGTLDIEKGVHGDASNVVLTFSKVTEGANTGKWSVTVRLLGVTGRQQNLAARIYFEGNTPGPVSLDSDLSADLSSFNTDKKTPLILGGKVVETPVGAGFVAKIDNWELIQRDPVVAD